MSGVIDNTSSQRATGGGGSGAWRDHWKQHTVVELDSISRNHQTKPHDLDIHIMRSSQVDAARLDTELASMLHEQFIKSFSLFKQTSISQYQPELMLILEFMIFKFSIMEGRPLPGMALMNLRHRSERHIHNRVNITNTTTHNNINSSTTGVDGVGGPGLSKQQRVLYCIGSVFLRYIWTRASQYITIQYHQHQQSSYTTTTSTHNTEQQQRQQRSWHEFAWNSMKTAETLYITASFINYLIFLKTGRYRNILERLLQARLVYAQSTAARAISYEYLNRQLVWSELSEVLLFLLPLVNVAAVKRTIRSIFPKLSFLGQHGMFSSSSSMSGILLGKQAPHVHIYNDNSSSNNSNNSNNSNTTTGDNNDNTIDNTHLNKTATTTKIETDNTTTTTTTTTTTAFSLIDSPCLLCESQSMVLPYAAHPCGHVFCYYCLRSRTLADPLFECPVCFIRVNALSPAIKSIE